MTGAVEGSKSNNVKSCGLLRDSVGSFASIVRHRVYMAASRRGIIEVRVNLTYFPYIRIMGG